MKEVRAKRGQEVKMVILLCILLIIIVTLVIFKIYKGIF